MECQTAQLKLQALIDKELDEDQIPEVIDHMEGCYACRQEYIEFLKLQKKMEGSAAAEPPAEWFEEVQKSKPRRGFVWIGMLLLVGSYLAMAVWGLIKTLQDSQAEIFPKLMIGGMIGGGLLLLLVTIMDRGRESRTDKYKEIQK